jgi:hypothetical protein
MQLPKLPPEPLRLQDDRDYQPELWQPDWHCFCCEDRGFVAAALAKMVIPDYQYGRDRIPVCQAKSCSFGANWMHLDRLNLDMRLRPEICDELDRISRQDWSKVTRDRAAIIKEKVRLSNQETADKMSLRKSQRSAEDERELEIKKSQVVAKYGL